MPITLKTLPQATAQEVFDQVATHLLAQNAKSMDCTEFNCQYRGEGWRMCAAGCLIGDDEYCPAMEGKTWRALNNWGYVPGTHCQLICSLQMVHDRGPVYDWRRLLRQLANDKNLSPAVLA